MTTLKRTVLILAVSFAIAGALALNILRDDQATWEAQTVETSRNLYSVHLYDPENILLAMFEGIKRTDDGGKSWPEDLQPSNPDNEAPEDIPRSIFSKNSSSTWVVGRNGMIAHSSDGGSLWEHRSTETHATLRDIHFADSRHGWAVGHQGTILHTTDGGDIWHEQDSGIESRINSVFFTDKATGWVAGYDGLLLRTTDGGENWKRLEAPAEQLESIHFTDSKTGWLATHNGIMYTENGGKDWEVQYREMLGLPQLFDIYFSDDHHGWAVGHNGIILHTEDGGNSWNRQHTGTEENIRSIHFVGKKDGWAVGDNGTVLKYSDSSD